jgi:hypothetical protein
MKMYFTICYLIFSTMSSLALAQDSTEKNPKVIEMEIMLTKEATNFLKQRIPTEPFYVNVEVTPLRRGLGSKNEQLPYFVNEDAIGDEWDSLDTPLVLLRARIKRAEVKVELPDTLSENDIGDLRNKLYEQLKLIPGRDPINITKKASTIAPPPQAKDYTLYYFMTGLSVIIFAGLFISLKFGPKPQEKTGAANASAAAPTMVAAPPMPTRSSSPMTFNGAESSKRGPGGDISFNDNIRVVEIVKEKMHGVINASNFPLLSDMLALDELCEKSLGSFGAFIFEMPRKNQQKVFFRARSDKWPKGYIEATTVGMDCYVIVQKMLRNRTASGPEKWEELLVQIWRLSNEAHLFLKYIPIDDAFAILAHLPKSFSLPIAKKTYPGGWARVLETREYTPIEDEAKLTDYLDRAMQLKPYFSFKTIDDYKKDLELVDYVKNATVKDEEEIYESLSPDSHLISIRPPFYVILKSSEEDFKYVFNQYSLSDWAIAVFNAPRDYIKKIRAELDDKKRYIFSTYLKELDETPPALGQQGSLREEIANTFKTHMIQKTAQVVRDELATNYQSQLNNKENEIKGNDTDENDRNDIAKAA